MSKYIKLEGLKWHSPDESLVKPLTEFYVTESDIADLPTIDIVRCKDCEYFKLHESVFGKGWICKRNHIVVGSVDFCSYGEMKDNE